MVAAALQLAKGAVCVENVQNIFPLSFLILGQRLFLPLGHIFENRDATTVEALRIHVLLEQADQFATDLAHLVVENELLVQGCLSVALWIPFDVCNVDTDEDSRSYCIFHALSIFFSALQTHIFLVVDTFVPALLNP